MKKLFLFSLFSLFSLAIYASGSEQLSNVVVPSAIVKSGIQSKIESSFLQFCSSANIVRNEVTITCSACRDTQLAADIAVADCIMDLMVLLPA
ncbi:MAG: hypothetical protein K2X48_01380 [Chitinophagaceae bacterium]|nr:hypothetical protein [Chitinophagaceae bacterium]